MRNFPDVARPLRGRGWSPSQNATHDTARTEGSAVYELELQRIRSAELRRQAQRDRLAREVVRARRAARHDAPAAESHTERPRRTRLPRTA